MKDLPQYEQIAGHYRAEITTGHLSIGDNLPTLRQIAAAWKVTRTTAARAVQQLRHEGLVTTGGRSGTRVVGAAETTVAFVLEQGMSVSGTSLMTALPDMAAEMGIEAGATILVVKLVMDRLRQ